MRVIFCILSLFILLNSKIFASDIIDVNISSNEVDVGDSIRLEIIIETSQEDIENREIQVTGIENFEIFSQSQGTSFQSINGSVSSEQSYILDLRPLNTGNYSLGPVMLLSSSDEIIDDEVFQITVGTSNLANIFSEEEQISLEKGGDGITDDRNQVFPFMMISSAAVLFLCIFYLLLQSILFSKREETVEVTLEEKNDFDTEIRKYFLKLKERNFELESQRFFRAYNVGVRKIFSHEGLQQADTATLKEITKFYKKSESKIYELFKKSYEFEYSGKNKTVETREKYIEKILELI